jgi:molybdenum cofactor biosynthesis enzyme MoaA
MADAGRAARRSLERVNFNFAAKCNMACRFCYVPFDGEEGSEVEAFAVVDELLARDVKSITFAGGDPLMYPYLQTLISRVKDTNPEVFVQLDTNALQFQHPDLQPSGLVDLYGIPLDAVESDGSFAMRTHRRHPMLVLPVIAALVQSGSAVKVNTVVSQLNRNELVAVGHAIDQRSVRRWSLYEFWAIGPIAIRNEKDYSLGHATYITIVEDIRRRFQNLLVEDGSIGSRTGSYLFVTQTGRVYTVDPHRRDRYLELGNMLRDATILDRWISILTLSGTDITGAASDFPQRIRQRIKSRTGWYASSGLADLSLREAAWGHMARHWPARPGRDGPRLQRTPVANSWSPAVTGRISRPICSSARTSGLEQEQPWHPVTPPTRSVREM